MKKHSGTLLWLPCFILSKEIQIKEKHLSEFVLVFDGMFKDVDMRDVCGMGGSSRLFFFFSFLAITRQHEALFIHNGNSGKHNAQET